MGEELNDLLSSTGEPEQRDIVNPKGVGLKTSEWAEIETIGNKLGVSGHAVAKYLLRYGLSEYRKDKLKINVVKQPKLEFPE